MVRSLSVNLFDVSRHAVACGSAGKPKLKSLVQDGRGGDLIHLGLCNLGIECRRHFAAMRSRGSVKSNEVTPADAWDDALKMTVPGYYAHLSAMKDGETMTIPQHSL